MNSRPLLHRLAVHREVDLQLGLPSRLADGLAAGRLDAALVPSIEYFRQRGQAIVSDACVASCGPVRSVKLYSRVPLERVRTVALDEGSRTSAALTQILLCERLGLRPQIERLLIGTLIDEVDADAIMLIGDRGLSPPSGRFAVEWDLGEQWTAWTGLPFVFALWVGRRGAEIERLGAVLGAARDQGVAHLGDIARDAATELGLPASVCLEYLRDNLRFRLGPLEREGLERFYDLAVRHGLAPPGVQLVFQH